MAAILQNGGVIILSMEQIVSRNGALLQDLCLKLVLLVSYEKMLCRTRFEVLISRMMNLL